MHKLKASGWERSGELRRLHESELARLVAFVPLTRVDWAHAKMNGENQDVWNRLSGVRVWYRMKTMTNTHVTSGRSRRVTLGSLNMTNGSDPPTFVAMPEVRERAEVGAAADHAPIFVPLEKTQTFEEFFAASYPGMVRLATALLPSRSVAEDVVQDAFTKSYARFTSLNNPEAYVRRSVVNLSTGYFRRRGVAQAKEPLLRPTEQPSEHDTMLSVLHQLPTRQRAALILRYYEQCNEAEIAAALQCRPGTVKSLLSRGIAALREVIDHE